ncbi:MAG: efflux RND transporter periplasmic adaptor subunit [Burkholderiales bacterium]|nr:efflux RND transporter periplasmic adaptor subunit [Burkholderiales bacterium]
MSETTKKIVLPGYLVRRLEAFRIVKGDATSYLLRDKVKGRTYDFDAWQFFLLESLPGLEQFEKIQAAFRDRFDRELTRKEFDEFVASVVDRKLLVEEAGDHPLLQRFMRPAYAVQDGQAVPKPALAGAVPAAEGAAAPPAPAAPPLAPAPPASSAPAAEAELPPGVQDALGLDMRTTERMLGLFDPRPLLRLLLPALRPLRHAVYVAPLLLLAALALLWNYFHLVQEDLQQLHLDTTLAEYLVFVFLTVRLCTTLSSALIAEHFKLAVEKVGLTLAFGFIPRWTLKMNGAERLTRAQTMWLHGGNLLVRLTLFALGVLVWFNARDGQPSMSQFGMLLGLGALAGLVLESGNPLVKSHAYYLLSAFLNEPHLRGKAFAALLNNLKGGVYRAADSKLLAVYALLSSTYVLLVVLLLARMLGRFLFGEMEIGGSAVLIVVGVVAYALWRNYLSLKKFAETYERQLQFDRWRSRTVPVEAGAAEAGRPQASYWPKAVLVALLVALFLPYPYEPGGSVMIYPARRQVVTVDEGGLVSEVFFRGGEHVKAGALLGRVVNADFAAQIAVLGARIDEQAAVVRNLKSLPKAEEVRLAEQRVALERTRDKFSAERVARLKPLLDIEAISREEYEAALKENMADREQVAQREAELALVKVPVTPSEIAAAEARLASLVEERATYESRIQRAELRMPFDGNLLTLNLQNKVGSFLQKGDAFANVEDTGTVTAEIEVQEGDIAYVQVGDEVRIRPVSFAAEREFHGKVTLIDRNITPKSTGSVIKVQATIDNRDGLLRTGMTGRAKVLGESMPVWQAFTRAIVRFVQVQVWSWIP